MQTRQIYSITDLIRKDMISAKQVAYLWKLMDDKDEAIIISGSTGAGKTTLLNALASLTRPNLTIDVFEDNMELDLDHRLASYYHKDKIKQTVRSNARLTILNEMRDYLDAHVIFQLADVGRLTMATFHADDIKIAISRLSIEPFNIPKHRIDDAHLVHITHYNTGRKVDGYLHQETNRFDITPDMVDDLEHRQTLLHKACSNSNSTEILRSYYD